MVAKMMVKNCILIDVFCRWKDCSGRGEMNVKRKSVADGTVDKTVDADADVHSKGEEWASYMCIRASIVVAIS